MSQSATLYRITATDFDRIMESPDNLDLGDIEAACETFGGSHEGLRYVLAKFDNAEATDEIFYPKTFIGKEIDFEDMSEAAMDELSRRIYYLNPATIESIHIFLSGLSVTYLKDQFDPAELNREEIYPWVWNNSKEQDTVYNEKHIIEDFEKLQSIFEKSFANRDYLLSYVG